MLANICLIGESSFESCPGADQPGTEDIVWIGKVPFARFFEHIYVLWNEGSALLSSYVFHSSFIHLMINKILFSRVASSKQPAINQT
jgi:hypothetical protein